jgi:hypothetical protein
MFRALISESSSGHKRKLRQVYNVKDKSIPLQAWTGPKGYRKLRFPDFVKKARDGGKVVSLKHRPPLPLGNAPDAHFC